MQSLRAILDDFDSLENKKKRLRDRFKSTLSKGSQKMGQKERRELHREMSLLRKWLTKNGAGRNSPPPPHQRGRRVFADARARASNRASNRTSKRNRNPFDTHNRPPSRAKRVHTRDHTPTFGTAAPRPNSRAGTRSPGTRSPGTRSPTPGTRPLNPASDRTRARSGRPSAKYRNQTRDQARQRHREKQKSRVRGQLRSLGRLPAQVQSRGRSGRRSTPSPAPNRSPPVPDPVRSTGATRAPSAPRPRSSTPSTPVPIQSPPVPVPVPVATRAPPPPRRSTPRPPTPRPSTPRPPTPRPSTPVNQFRPVTTAPRRTEPRRHDVVRPTATAPMNDGAVVPYRPRGGVGVRGYPQP